MGSSPPLGQPRSVRIANRFLLGLCLLSAVLFLYKTVKDGRHVNLPLVLALAALAAGFTWAMTFSPRNKLRVCLVGLSSIYTLLILELCIVTFHLQLRRFGEPLDVRDPYEKLAALDQLRRTGVAYPAVVPHRLTRSNGLAAGTGRVFPLAGISRTLTLLSKESGFWKSYVSDEHGFNNPPGSYSAGAAPVVLIGDSFVHGASVKEENDMAGWIRQSGQPAINLGFWANGPLLELATLTEYGIAASPRAIFWVYFEGNDLGELAEEKKAQLLRNYLDDSYTQHLWGRQDLIDQLLKKYCDMKERQLREPGKTQRSGQSARMIDRARNWPIARIVRLVHLRSLFETVYRRREIVVHGWDKTQVTEDEFSLFREILAAAQRRTKQAGAAFYFVYLPDQTRFSKRMAQSAAWKHRGKIMSIIESLRIPTIDFSEDIARQPDPLSFYISRAFYSHFNAAGNEFVARAALHRLAVDGK
jgi:hypothetical protein